MSFQHDPSEPWPKPDPEPEEDEAKPPYNSLDCTCESDPLGRCVIPAHNTYLVRLDRPVQRTLCPFFGFAVVVPTLCGFPPLLLDQGSNQCALRKGYSPCLMTNLEASDVTATWPDWSQCIFLNVPDKVVTVGYLRLAARIYPNEHDTEERPGIWKGSGIPFEDWFQERTARP